MTRKKSPIRYGRNIAVGERKENLSLHELRMCYSVIETGSSAILKNNIARIRQRKRTCLRASGLRQPIREAEDNHETWSEGGERCSRSHSLLGMISQRACSLRKQIHDLTRAHHKARMVRLIRPTDPSSKIRSFRFMFIFVELCFERAKIMHSVIG